MPASLHLVHHRPGRAAAMLAGMWRHRRAFAATPGLVTARLYMIADLDTVTGGFPAPTKWALFCGWADADARDAFCADGAAVVADGAREAWGVALETVRAVEGDLHGWTPDSAGVRRLASDEPLAVMTHGLVRARYLPRFTADNRRIVRDMASDPGSPLKVGLLDRPNCRATFSLWPSQGDVVRFAYGKDAIHRPIQRRSLDVPWSRDLFFARFRLLTTTGSWNDRDPLADLRVAAPGAVA